ncbi:hypothetical protein EB077_14300, partial [bacterium]|nr:hypothetical protein [bacterium]
EQAVEVAVDQRANPAAVGAHVQLHQAVRVVLAPTVVHGRRAAGLTPDDGVEPWPVGLRPAGVERCLTELGAAVGGGGVGRRAVAEQQGESGEGFHR